MRLLTQHEIMILKRLLWNDYYETNRCYHLILSDVIYNQNVIWNYKVDIHVIELTTTNYTKTNCNLITILICNWIT